MDYAVIKPKTGIRLKDPVDYSELPVNGKRVKMNTYWRRRLKDGSAEIVTQVAKPVEAPKTKETN